MQPIATQSIWFEPFDELVLRWLRRRGEQMQAEAGSAREAAERAAARAEKVLRYSGTHPPKLLRTAREWQARWDGREAWRRVESIVRGLGWKVVRHRAGSGTGVSEVLLDSGEEPAVLIADEPLQSLQGKARESGLALPLTVEDMAVLALSRECYAILSERMGKRPPEWIDELAETEFTRRLLGLPFHPLVLSLI